MRSKRLATEGMFSCRVSSGSLFRQGRSVESSVGTASGSSHTSLEGKVRGFGSFRRNERN